MIGLDIETYKEVSDSNYVNWKLSGITAPGNYKDPTAIERYIMEQKVKEVERFALSPLTGRIILIGLMLDYLPPANIINITEDNILDFPELGNIYYIPLIGDEKEMLTKFWEIFSHHSFNSSGMVSFNGKAFDLPFIMNRTLINKIIPPYRFKMDDYLSKYRHQPHFDAYNWLNGGSLVEWSYRLGLTDSLQRDGNKIGGWYEAGNMNLIVDKNKIDIAQSISIYGAVKQWL